MNRLPEIREYFLSLGYRNGDLDRNEKSSISLSEEIMHYTHRNQYRKNGEKYENHPLRCRQNYLNLISFAMEGSKINEEKLKERNIPYQGVQETCLLHDVIEDTDFTIDDLEDIFTECGFKGYFNVFIRDPLIRLTHAKSVDYYSYIQICMANPISAICKMMDLQDNSSVLSLMSFDECSYQRTQKYLTCLYSINNKYHYIEAANHH